MTATTVKASPTVEAATAAESSAETRLPASGESSGDSAMVKTAECTRMIAGLGMWWGKPMLRSRKPMLRSGPMEPRISTVKSAGVIEVRASPIEAVAIDEDSTVGYIGVVVVNDSAVPPVRVPVVPAPAKSAKVADSKAETKRNSGSGKVQPWIPIPTRPNPNRFSVRQPRVIFRHVHDLRIGWLDHNGLPLLSDVFLRCAL